MLINLGSSGLVLINFGVNWSEGFGSTGRKEEKRHWWNPGACGIGQRVQPVSAKGVCPAVWLSCHRVSTAALPTTPGTFRSQRRTEEGRGGGLRLDRADG